MGRPKLKPSYFELWKLDPVLVHQSLALVDHRDALGIPADAPQAGEDAVAPPRGVVGKRDGDDVVKEDVARRALRLDDLGKHDVVGPNVVAFGGGEVNEDAYLL